MANQRDMSGTLAKNKRKEKPSHADYAGSITIEGQEYWLNGWIKEGEYGKFLSLSVRPKEERQRPSPSRNSNHNMRREDYQRPVGDDEF
ncbi:MAG: hypothetical protein EHM35_02250 [Planctomycetaceae bacterium]|nr:MAG: hypothetical protein EHM35_02250 [Planctomycetaceae bacterium]